LGWCVTFVRPGW